MPKHFKDAFTKMEYHPIIIRFTSKQITDLKTMSEKRKESISSIMRKAAEREYGIFALSSDVDPSST